MAFEVTGDIPVKVLISWSGEPSKQIAMALREWLPMVIQAVDPYMSEEDNHAGVRWLQSISTELDASDFGIVCVTPANVRSPWLNFEAGALSKAVDRARVVPLLHGFSSLSDVAPPLGQFQAKMADKSGLRALLTAINENAEPRVEPQRLMQLFELAWSDLEEKLRDIPHAPESNRHIRQRSERDLLEEILEILRRRDSATANEVAQALRAQAARAAQATRQSLIDFDYDKPYLIDRLRELVGPDGSVYTKKDAIELYSPNGLDAAEVAPYKSGSSDLGVGSGLSAAWRWRE